MSPVTTNNTTANHALQLWQQVPEDQEDWQNRTDMETIEVGLEVRDLDANKGNHTPHDGAAFRATDTNDLYIGNGETWEHQGRLGSGLTAIRDAADFDGANGGEQIQAALDDLPDTGGIVYVPPEGPDTNGRWDVSSTIVPPSNATLTGVENATRLYLTDTTNADVVSTATDDTATDPVKENITIEGLHIDGNGSNQNDTGGTYLYGSCGIRPLNVNGCVVRDCTTVNTKKHGIEVKKAKNVTVENCTVGNAGDDGISVTDTLFDEVFSENVVVSDCRAYGASDNGMEVDDGPRNVRFMSCVSHDNDTNGFTIHTHRATDPRNDGSSDITYSPGAPQEVYFTDCASVNNARLGFAVGHHAMGNPRDYFLDGVYARGNGESPFREEISTASDSSVEITNVNVTNFYFEGTALQNETGGWTAGFSMQRAQPWNDVTISDGIITGTLGYGMNLAACSIDGLTVNNVIIEAENVESYVIYAATDGNGRTVKDFRFTNSVVKDGPVGALAFNIASGDSFVNGQISNCTFKNNGRGSRTGSQWDSGIILFAAGAATLENIAVSGNLCYDDDAGTQEYGIYRDSADYCTYTGNILHGNVQAQFGGTLGSNSVEAANISRP